MWKGNERADTLVELGLIIPNSIAASVDDWVDYPGLNKLNALWVRVC